MDCQRGQCNKKHFVRTKRTGLMACKFIRTTLTVPKMIIESQISVSNCIFIIIVIGTPKFDVIDCEKGEGREVCLCKTALTIFSSEHYRRDSVQISQRDQVITHIHVENVCVVSFSARRLGAKDSC